MERPTEEIVDAWERAAREYRARMERDINELKAGRCSLLPLELTLLGDLKECRRAIHLQCSHGQDALSLWLLGVREVVGVDISEGMLAIASEKARRLGVPSRWVQGDVASLDSGMIGAADLVYTGKGALPWVRDIEAWARAIGSILVPGGRFCLYEQHPLTWVWDPSSDSPRLRDDGGDYFYSGTRPSNEYAQWNDSRHLASNGSLPRERQWTLGDIVTSLAQAGLRLVLLREHPDHFWDQFPDVPESVARRLPQTVSIEMVRE